MGKKLILKDPKTGKVEIWNEGDYTIFTEDDFIKCGARGKKEQYKYFCEHPEEIEDEKLFSELKEEFGDVEDKKI